MFYTFDWTDGRAYLATIEPKVIGDFTMCDGEPEIVVLELRLDGMNLLASHSPSVRALAREIKLTVENDSDWLAELAEDNGWVYMSRGANDPDARWKQIA